MHVCRSHPPLGGTQRCYRDHSLLPHLLRSTSRHPNEITHPCANGPPVRRFPTNSFRHRRRTSITVIEIARQAQRWTRHKMLRVLMTMNPQYCALPPRSPAKVSCSRQRRSVIPTPSPPDVIIIYCLFLKVKCESPGPIPSDDQLSAVFRAGIIPNGLRRGPHYR